MSGPGETLPRRRTAMTARCKAKARLAKFLSVHVFIVFGVLIPMPTAAQVEGQIMISASPVGVGCSIIDAAPGLHTVYVLHTLNIGTKATRFRIEAGPGMTMTYVSETHAFPQTVGNTQTGISICYGDCLLADMALVSMTYMGYGTSTCGKLLVVPHPTADVVEAINCNDVPVRTFVKDMYVESSPGSCGCPLVRSLQGTPQYFDCSPVSVESTTWGAIKALYARQ